MQVRTSQVLPMLLLSTAVAWSVGGVAQASLVFETDFTSATGTTVNGTTGGTATLTSTGYESIQTGTPMITGAAGYLEVAVPNAALNPGAGVNITGSTTNDPMNLWIGTPITVGSSSDVNINGAFDFFFRSSVVSSSWTGTSYIFSIGGPSINKELKLQLYTNKGGLKIILNSSSTFNVGIAADNIYHIAGTVSTDQSTGAISLDLYSMLGNTAITTGSPNTTVSIAALAASSYSNNFGNSSVLFGNTSFSASNAMTNNFDTLRIYDSVPATFGTMAVPEPTALGLFAIGSLALLLRQRKTGGLQG